MECEENNKNINNKINNNNVINNKSTSSIKSKNSLNHSEIKKIIFNNNNFTNKITNPSSFNSEDINNNINNIYNINNNNNNVNNYQLFKSKDQSRFFNDNFNYKFDNEDISDEMKNLIDQILLRYGFFNKFNYYFKLNELENNFCQNIYKQTKDDNIKFVFDNIN